MSDVDSSTRLYDLDISPCVQTREEHWTDKYGKEKSRTLQYLEWATAWRLVREIYPSATFKIHDFKEGDKEVPYNKTNLGTFVRVTVTIEGREESDTYPVNAKDEDADGIAYTHQRALVKCLGRHGLGLKLWEKEARDKLVGSEHPAKSGSLPLPPGEYRFGIKNTRNYGKTLDEIGLPGVTNDLQYWHNRLKMEGKPATGEVKKFIENAEAWVKAKNAVTKKASGSSLRVDTSDEPPPFDDIPF
jgi:hypothetical protein